jgi:uncharacterized protein
MPPVLILLPPSETKTSPITGPALDLGKLCATALNAHRNRVIDSVMSLSASPAKARAALGLSARQDDEITRNAALRDAPTAPAIQVYTGVLYDAMGFGTLSPSARNRLHAMTYVQSALFGVVSAGDAIPAYRLSADSTLPRLGSMATWWKAHLALAMPDLIGSDPVLDMRSGAYAAMWKPQGEFADSTVTARVLVDNGSGVRKIVSHHNKATKGRLLRALAQSRRSPRTVQEIAAACESAGFTIELHNATKSMSPWRMDIIVTEV